MNLKDQPEDEETPGPPSKGAIDRMAGVVAQLRRDERLSDCLITQPHALFVALWRTMATPNGRGAQQLCVLFAPAALWDRARDLLLPFADRFAEATRCLCWWVAPGRRSTKH